MEKFETARVKLGGFVRFGQVTDKGTPVSWIMRLASCHRLSHFEMARHTDVRMVGQGPCFNWSLGGIR